MKLHPNKPNAIFSLKGVIIWAKYNGSLWYARYMRLRHLHIVYKNEHMITMKWNSHKNLWHLLLVISYSVCVLSVKTVYKPLVITFSNNLPGTWKNIDNAGAGKWNKKDTPQRVINYATFAKKRRKLMYVVIIVLPLYFLCNVIWVFLVDRMSFIFQFINWCFGGRRIKDIKLLFRKMNTFEDIPCVSLWVYVDV